MKPFHLSKHFWIPFFVCLLLFLSWLGYEMGRLYGDDIFKEGIPASASYGFIIHNLLLFFPLGISLAFFMGIVLYAAREKRKGNGTGLFSFRSFYPVITLALIQFAYAGFVVPLHHQRSADLLMNLVYHKAGTQWKVEELRQGRRENMLSFFELVDKKDAFRKEQQKEWELIKRDIKQNIREEDLTHVLDDLKEGRVTLTREEIMGANTSFSTVNSWNCCIKNPILQSAASLRNASLVSEYKMNGIYASMLASPFNILVIYLWAMLLGIAMYRLPAYVPVLVSLLVGIPVWIYMTRYFDSLYQIREVSAFMGQFGPALVHLALALGIYFILRSRGFFPEKSEMETFFEEQEKQQENLLKYR